MNAPELVPEVVYVTDHAIKRYAERRHTNPDHVAAGIFLLLQKAATKPLPPVQGCLDGSREASRRYRVGGYCLVMTADLSTLVTLYRDRGHGARIRPR